MKKRIWSLIFTICMLIMLVPSTVFAEQTDYKEIYFNFLKDELITKNNSIYCTGATLADLNLDGTPELVIYDGGASASAGVNICQIIDNEVQLRYAYYLRNDENINKDYLDSSIPALHLMGWPPSDFNEDEEYTFSLRKNKYTGELMYVHFSHAAAADFSDNPLLCFSKDNIFNASEKFGRCIERDWDDTITSADYRIDGNAVSAEDYDAAYNEFIDTWQDTGYELKYLDGYNCTEQKIGEFLNCYIPEKRELGLTNDLAITDNDELLKKYAKENLLIFTPDHHTDKTFVGNDIRYLLIDITGDNKNDLIEVGIIDNDLIDVAIYTNDNGTIKRILCDSMTYYAGSYCWIALYEGKYYIGWEGLRPYNSGKSLSQLTSSEQRVHYYDITDTARNEDGSYEWGVYKVNGEFVDEDTYNYYNDLIVNKARKLTVDDFMTLEELLATNSTDDSKKYGYVDVMPVSRRYVSDGYEVRIRLTNNSDKKITNKRIQLAYTTITNTKTNQQKEVVLGYISIQEDFEPYEEKLSGVTTGHGSQSYTTTEKPLGGNYIKDSDSDTNLSLIVIQFDNDKEYDEFLQEIQENEISDCSTVEKIEKNEQWLKKLKEGK